MTLIELSRQYNDTAKRLYDRTKELKAIMNDLPSNQRIVMKRRIYLLHYDAAECRRCSKILNQHSTKETET